MCVQRRRHTDDDFTYRIKIEAPILDGAYDSKVFSNWLVDIYCYFIWYNMHEECKILIARMRLVGPVRIYCAPERV